MPTPGKLAKDMRTGMQQSSPAATKLRTIRTPEPKTTVPAPEEDQTDFLKDQLQVAKERAAALGSEDRQWYTDKIAELDKEYEERKKQVGLARAAETIGQALLKLGSAWYGLKTGLDMSGAKFDRADWSKEYDRALKERTAKGAEVAKELGQRRTFTKAFLDKIGKEKETKDAKIVRVPGYRTKDKKHPVGRYQDRMGLHDLVTGSPVEEDSLEVANRDVIITDADGRQWSRDAAGNLTNIHGQIKAIQGKPKSPESYKDLPVRDREKVDKIGKEYRTKIERFDTALEGLNNLDNLITADIDGSRRAIQNFLARSMGEKGVMTEQDVAGFVGSETFLNRLKQYIHAKTKGGTIDEIRSNYTDLVTLMQDTLAKNKTGFDQRYRGVITGTLALEEYPEWMDKTLGITQYSPEPTDLPKLKEESIKTTEIPRMQRGLAKGLKAAGFEDDESEISEEDRDEIQKYMKANEISFEKAKLLWEKRSGR